MEQNTTDIHRYYKHFEDTIRYRFLKEEHLNHFLKEMKAAFRWTVQNFTHYPIYHDDGCALVFYSEKKESLFLKLLQLRIFQKKNKFS